MISVLLECSIFPFRISTCRTSHQSLSEIETQNQHLKRELATITFPHHHRSNLRQLEVENAKLQVEVSQAKARQLKMQNRRLAAELKSLNLPDSGGRGVRTSSLASYPAFEQKLAWYGPAKKYGSLSLVPGFNPLSIVTRADKTMDPDFRPPLRVSFLTAR